MPCKHDQIVATIGATPTDVVVGDFSNFPIRDIAIKNTGAVAFAAATLLRGPTASGPWFAEGGTPATTLATLGASASVDFALTCASRFMKLTANCGPATSTTVTIYVDAEG